jgi:glycosyltransferase involved in cell wall biosynthesis
MALADAELAVIIPVYNEEEIIGKVLDDWSNELNRLEINYEINVYNDGSKDNTLAILKEYSSNNKRVVIHNKTNSGHGPTVLLGYRENSDVEWIFQIDSDGEIGPESFQTIWERRGRYDLLLGRRVGRHSGVVRASLSYFARLAIMIFYGSEVHDVNSPFRLMRGEQFKEIFFKIPEGTFAPNVILSGAASRARLRILEHPVHYSTRKTGEVSLKKMKLLRAALRSLFQTIKFRFHI